MAKSLVLGSKGQIGLSLCNFLKFKEEEYEELDIVNSQNEDLRYISEFIENKFKEAEFVYFLAYDVGGSHYLSENQKQAQFLNNNLLIMHNCFKYLEKYNARFVFASTQMSNMTHSPYGTLKRLGEHYTKILNGKVVRFWNTYGLENDPKKTHVITDFIESALKDKKIKMRTNGQESRQFLHADDCSNGLFTIKKKYNDLNNYLDITSHKWTKIIDIANIISHIIGDVQIYPGDKLDNVQNNISNEPEKYFLDYWEPKITLEEGIKKIVREVQKKQN